MINIPPISIRPAIVVVLFFFLGASACSGCGGCGSDDQIGAQAENFSADTKVAFGLQSLEDLITTPEKVAGSDQYSDEIREEWEENFANARQNLKEQIGIDAGDPDAWKEWGIDPEGAFFVGVVDSTAISCLPVADEDDFHQFLLDSIAGKLLQVEDPEHSEEEIDGHSIYTIDDELAWAYRDDSACLAIPSFETEAVDAITTFMDGPGDDSLADEPGFSKFSDSELPGSLLALYVQNDPDFWSDLLGFHLPAEALEFVEEQLGEMYLGFGSTISVDDDIFRFRLWGGMDDDNLQTARESMTSEHDMDWSRFATENTTAAYRMSFNPQRAWQQFKDDSDDDVMDGVEFAFDQVDRETDGAIDVEKDLIENLTGHLGFFVYDIDDPDSLFDRGGPDFERDLEFVAIVQFIDEDALADTLDEVVSMVDAEMPISIEFRPLQEDDGSDADDIEVLEIPMMGYSVYRSADLLLFSNDALSEPEIASYIRGERSEASLADTDAVLGSALQEDSFTGLYLAGDVWAFVEEAAQFPGASDYFQEALFHTHSTDTGMAMDAEFYPAGSVVFGAGIVFEEAFRSYISRSKAAEADAIVATMGDSAVAYFEGDQIYSPQEGAEPWHAADDGDAGKRPGMFVPFDDKVFPGGADIKIMSSQELPEGGEKITPDPVIVGDVDFDAEDVFRTLNVNLEDDTYFRYTFETGPHTGDSATATIRAEANFDPSTPDHHITIQEIEVSGLGAQAFPMYSKNYLQ